MGKQQKKTKRKLSENGTQAIISDKHDSSEEEYAESEDEDLFGIVNNEHEDSSDSDREVDESDEEHEWASEEEGEDESINQENDESGEEEEELDIIDIDSDEVENEETDNSEVDEESENSEVDEESENSEIDEEADNSEVDEESNIRGGDKELEKEIFGSYNEVEDSSDDDDENNDKIEARVKKVNGINGKNKTNLKEIKGGNNVESNTKTILVSVNKLNKINTKKNNKQTRNKKNVRNEKLGDTRTKTFRENRLDKDKVEKAEDKQPNEYEYDSSDEEDIRNTVGNIPMNWYDEYKHLGYDWDGKQIVKPNQGDQLDEFLKRMEDPDFWRTVKDPQTGQDVVLSQEDIDLIRRIQSQKIPDATFDEYAPWIEWFTSEVEKMPLRKFPEHKRSFLPSKWEAKKVSKLVHALKMGWIKTMAEKEKMRAKKDPQFYMLWQTDDQAEEMRRIHKHIAAPKRHLPGHAESYNPPPEYLFDAKELKQWNKMKNSPWKRKLHFVPQKYESLRKVPSYPRFIKERFLRCLDLYLCPRAIKMKLTIEPDALVPKLPSPRDLQPFPTVLSITYEGHTDMVRSISTDKFGQYLVSGSDDCTVKIWEVNSGRCIKTIPVEGIVRSVEWCPNASISLILVAANNRVLLINPRVGDFVISDKTDEVLKDAPKSEVIIPERVKTTIVWEEPTEEEYEKGFRMILKHFKEVAQVTWHGKGDYFATVMPEGANRSVLISQLSKRRSQLPFSKAKGLVQCVLFHPTRPLLFVATQRHVRVYDLVKQMLVKKLMTNSKWISRMAVHSGGDNLLVGTYDRKILWFDLDLSTKPYQTLRLHGTAVRGIAFHKRYPLFASGSDDRSLIVSHGMVYNDLLKNALIVPLKRLQDHEQRNDFGIFDVKFHPLQPWVFSSGADGTIKMYCN